MLNDAYRVRRRRRRHDAGTGIHKVLGLLPRSMRALLGMHMARQLEKIMSGQRDMVMHDVWHCLLARGFMGHSRCRGFECREGGGGHWTKECPFCVDVKFTKPSPCVPATISGRSYERHPPKLLHGTRIMVRSAVVLDDGSFGPVRAHTVEFIKYAQLINDSECKRCFKCVPTVPCARPCACLRSSCTETTLTSDRVRPRSQAHAIDGVGSSALGGA